MDPHVVQERAGADAAAGVLEIGQMGARLSVAEADLEVVRDEYLDVPVLRWVCTNTNGGELEPICPFSGSDGRDTRWL